MAITRRHGFFSPCVSPTVPLKMDPRRVIPPTQLAIVATFFEHLGLSLAPGERESAPSLHLWGRSVQHRRVEPVVVESLGDGSSLGLLVLKARVAARGRVMIGIGANLEGLVEGTSVGVWTPSQRFGRLGVRWLGRLRCLTDESNGRSLRARSQGHAAFPSQHVTLRSH